MKSIYDASNLVEAHMVRDLLRQQGLTAEVHGEYLAGGIGELPANGLVRVVVDEVDEAAARRVIAEFEAAQPAPASDAATGTARQPPPSRLAWGFGGLVVGVMLAAWGMHTPMREDGIDHDRNGELDEHWFYGPTGLPLRVEADRNLDHRIDTINHYDAQGRLDHGESDDDFDGRFETRWTYHLGSAQSSQSDVDGDSYAEIRQTYIHGMLDTSTIMDPASGQALRVEHFKLGGMTHAEIDSDRDGRLDTRLRYNALLEVTGREPL